MAHFALLSNTNVVVRVVVVDTDAILDENGNENEAIGQSILQKLFRHTETWKKASYNTRRGQYYKTNTIDELHEDQSKAYRLNFPGTGWTYNAEIDGFVEPKRFPSMILNTSTGIYEYPIPYPADAPDEDSYIWNEEQQRWDPHTFE